MKHKKIISVIALISLLVLVGASTNCSLQNADATDMTKKIPEDADSFFFIDIDELRSDDDLEDFYENLEDVYGYWSENFDIDFDDIDSLAMYGSTILIEGDFNLDDIREELEDLDYNDDEYKDVEVWKSDDGYTWVAMKGNLIIMGSEESVKDCIKVIEEGEDSLRDDKDCKDVMDRLPGGIFVMYDTVEEYQGLEASGVSIQTKDEDTLKVTAIFKFEDEDAAEDAMDEIEDYADEEDFHHINVDQDGDFVKATAEVDINDFDWFA